MSKSLNVKNCASYCDARKNRELKFSKGRGFLCSIFSPGALSFVLLGMIGAAGIVYIFQVNKLATMGYTINQKQEKLEELRERKRELEIKTASLKSVYQFKAKKEIFDMVEPEKIGYIEVDYQDSVAMK